MRTKDYGTTACDQGFIRMKTKLPVVNVEVKWLQMAWFYIQFILNLGKNMVPWFSPLLIAVQNLTFSD